MRLCRPKLRLLIRSSCLVRAALWALMRCMATGDTSAADIFLCDLPSAETDWSLGTVMHGRGGMGGVSSSYNNVTFGMGTSYLLLDLAGKGGKGPARAANPNICLLVFFGLMWSAISSGTPASERPGCAI